MVHQITETERIVAQMLVENTGTHMLDSGGASGRAWQQNQKKVGEQDPVEFFRAQPFGKIDVSLAYTDFKGNHYGPSINYITVDLFHWMTSGMTPSGGERFTYLADEDAAFYAWVEKQEDEYESYFSLVERYVEEVIGTTPNTGYTYNEENVLSQDIHYTFFSPENKDDWYYADDLRVFIHIHGGADARGGFTRPRLFEASEDALDWRRAGVGCDKCSATWSCDDAIELRDAEGMYPENVPSLVGRYNDPAEVVYIDQSDVIEVAKRKLDEWAAEDSEQRGLTPIQLLPVCYVVPTGPYTGDLICPICESGKLHVYPF